MVAIMTPNAHRLPRYECDEGFTAPVADNENLPLLLNCAMTPAEIIQWARREKKRLARKVAADPRLWTCPDHRRTWNATIGIEKLTLWQCFGIMDVS
jgi:hypothetical protein